MNIVKNLFKTLLVTSLLTTVAFAGTQKLAYITNEEDKEIIDLLITTDSRSDITSMKLVFKRANGKAYMTNTYSPRQAIRGVVLLKKKNREIVKLVSRNFTSHNGGDVKIDYLISGFSGRRGAKHMDLVRDSDKWSLKVNRKKIKKMHFVSNKKAFVGTIGIKTITTR